MDCRKKTNSEQTIDPVFLKAALDDVGAYIFTKDLNGCYTFANKKVLELFAISLNDLIGKDDSHFFDSKGTEQLRSNDRRVMEQGETIESEEHNIIKAGGDQKVYWSIKKPIYDDNGEIIGMCGISTDITERKRLEHKIQEQNKLFDTVLNNIDAYVYMKDNNHTFHYVNNKTAQLFGLPAEQIIGKRDTDILPRDIAEHFWQLDNKVFLDNQKHAGEESFIDKEGNSYHYWSIKVPFKFEGDLQTLIGFSTDITDLYKLKEELQLQATTDALTSLYNRRYFYEQANREFSRSNRQQQQLSLLIIDIDHFKKVNDQFGHLIGDEVLVSTATNFLPLIREGDVLARIGGEEFAILLPSTPPEAAAKMAERIRRFQSNQKVTGKWDGSINITISIGVAVINQTDKDFNDLFLRADKALYQAKQQGRNQVQLNY